MAAHRLCGVDGCDKRYHAHGYCARHAARFRAHGDPLGGREGSSPGEPLRWIETHKNHVGDDCLTWPFEVGRYGYGTVKHDGKRRVASRVMCEFAHGEPQSQDLDAAHSCGNGHKGCMNPAHLRWATRSENMAEAKAHGTYWDGRFKASATRAKASGMNPIDEVVVRSVRSLEGKMIQKEIAAQHGISVGTVGRILRRERWAWVDG